MPLREKSQFFLIYHELLIFCTFTWHWAGFFHRDHRRSWPQCDGWSKFARHELLDRSPDDFWLWHGYRESNCRPSPVFGPSIVDNIDRPWGPGAGVIPNKAIATSKHTSLKFCNSTLYWHVQGIGLTGPLRNCQLRTMIDNKMVDGLPQVL